MQPDAQGVHLKFQAQKTNTYKIPASQKANLSYLTAFPAKFKSINKFIYFICWLVVKSSYTDLVEDHIKLNRIGKGVGHERL